MKSSDRIHLALVSGLAIALLSSGCSRPSPPPRTTRIVTPAPVVVKVPAEPRVVVAQPAPTTTVTTSAPAPAPAPALTASPATVTNPTVTTAAPTPNPAAATPTIEDTLSGTLAKIVQMYESGVSETVMSAYAKNSAEPFYLSSEQIIFLSDVGFSDELITAMIEHDNKLGVQVEQTAPPETTQTPVYVQGSPPATQTTVEAATSTQTVIIKERPAVTTQVFYDELSPYGTWIYLNDYGWAWQPTVATVNVNWRPYYDRGHWLYTDAGWYWNSGYSWGWAPFHYGRWTLRAGYGWCWLPGTTWAPSWVSWRYTDAYCGWAPLPPYADYSVGVGFTYRGSRVGVGFGFGLGYSHYAFVNRGHFGRRGRHYGRGDRLDNSRTQQVYNDSTVINNYIVGDNNTIINEGISRDRLRTGNREEVKRVSLADVGNARGARGGERRGNQGEAINVYRPRVADTEGSPNKRQLARQETRATRQRIEERSGRSLRQEPTRVTTRASSGANTLAARTANTSGRIAPNRSSSTTASTSKRGLQSRTANSASSSSQLTSRANRGTPNQTRVRNTSRPSRPTAVTSNNKQGASRLATMGRRPSSTSTARPSRQTEIAANRAASTSNRTQRLQSRSTSSSNRSPVQARSANPTTPRRPGTVSTAQPSRRNEIVANRAATNRARLEAHRNRSTSVSSRARATTQPQRRPSPSSNITRRNVPNQTTRQRQTPSNTVSSRARVQSSTRSGTPNTTRSQSSWRPTRTQQPSPPTYQSRNRPNTSASPAPQINRPSPSVSRRTPSTPSYQRRSAPTPSRSQPSYQAPRRSSPTPSRSYSRPSTPSRSSSPSYSRPSTSTSSRSSSPSYSRSSRTSSPSRSYSSPTRSAPSRSRGAPSR